MTEENPQEEPQTVIVIGLEYLNYRQIIAMHHAFFELAWAAAEKLSGKSEEELRAIGYRAKLFKLIPIDEEAEHDRRKEKLNR